ncbi:MAG: choice-of-anchor I domain-containing protein, partial [Anaerovoracaceae bacterium]
EYIAVSGNTAYVSLQEANSIAVLDITSGTFTGVYPLGFQNYGATKVDIQKNDAIGLENYNNVYGIKMPDGISVTTIGGKTYLLTANEGDSRADWAGLDNEYENVTSPTGNVTLDKKVVWFNATMWDGLDSDKAYVFGGRSFSIYEVTNNGLNLVYDSGCDFEAITAEKLPAYFNASNDKISMDNRSGKKGPEPESVVTGTVGGKTYAFIALERIGGIMVYDITDPANAKFVNYINSREFDTAIQGDVSPEGLCFIPETESKTGKAILLAACEVSGTLAVYQCDPAASNVPPAYIPDIPSIQNPQTNEKNPEETEKDPASEKLTKEEIIAALGNQDLVAHSSIVTLKNGKTGIKVTWKAADGKTMQFDGVEIFRSTQRNKGYGKKPFYVSKKAGSTGTYINTKDVKQGTRYYYKVRGYVLVDGQKIYTDFSTKAWRTVKEQ